MTAGLTRRTFMTLGFGQLVPKDDDYRWEVLKHELDDLRHEVEMRLEIIEGLLVNVDLTLQYLSVNQIELRETVNFNARLLTLTIRRLEKIEEVLATLLRRGSSGQHLQGASWDS